MKPKDLPEAYKYYDVTMTDKSMYVITGDKKESLLKAESQFIQLENGSVINKAHIVGIHFKKTETIDKFRALPESKQKEMMSAIESYKKNA